MLGAFQQRKKLYIQIIIGFIVVLIGGAMVITLAPLSRTGAMEDSGESLADVDGQRITLQMIQEEIRRSEAGGQRLPPQFKSMFAEQKLEQLIDQYLLESEAKRLGMSVTDQERRTQIEQMLPTVFTGQAFLGMERYTAEVQLRFGMSVPEFEQAIGKAILQQKFRRLITDGITVSPQQIEQEFRRQNEKVKLEYALVSPGSLESRITPSEQELASYFEANKARYQVPERRKIRYVLLDANSQRSRASVSDEELQTYYNQHIDQYAVQNRVHLSQIIFRTIGKTDAEIAEIRKKAEDILKQAKKGGKFDELAKKHSEDTTKEKGGDLGWIVAGQTPPEFERAAFSLPKGSISDLIQTSSGFQIIQVLDRETAHTRGLNEVRESIRAALLAQKMEDLTRQAADQLTSAVRQSNRRPIEEVAKQFGLNVQNAPPLERTEVAQFFGQSPGLDDSIFNTTVGELAGPLQTERGYIVFNLTEAQPAHQGALAEVRDRVLGDYRREKSVEMARKMAEEIAMRAQAGENLTQAAKMAAAEVKTSDLISRTGTIPGLGNGSQLSSAFSMKPGQVGKPVLLGTNWAVFKVVDFQPANPAEFALKKTELEQQILSTERNIAFEAFLTALRDRMTREGKLQISQKVQELLKAIT